MSKFHKRTSRRGSRRNGGTSPNMTHGSNSASARGHQERRDEREELGCGRNFLDEMLRHRPERIARVYVASPKSSPQTSGGTDDRTRITAALRQHGISTVEADPSTLTQIARSDAHQGFVTVLNPRVKTSLKEVLTRLTDAPHSLLVMADSIEDPHNLGAILRACECFGADALIISTNRGTGVTASARKASVGASELVEIIEVSNLAESLRRCRDAGYWAVASEARPDSQNAPTFEFPPRTLIMLGAEGSGLHALLREGADYAVQIPMLGKIDSLNVSQATAVMLYEYRRRYPRSV